MNANDAIVLGILLIAGAISWHEWLKYRLNCKVVDTQAYLAQLTYSNDNYDDHGIAFIPDFDEGDMRGASYIEYDSDEEDDED